MAAPIIIETIQFCIIITIRTHNVINAYCYFYSNNVFKKTKKETAILLRFVNASSNSTWDTLENGNFFFTMTSMCEWK